MKALFTKKAFKSAISNTNFKSFKALLLIALAKFLATLKALLVIPVLDLFLWEATGSFSLCLGLSGIHIFSISLRHLPLFTASFLMTTPLRLSFPPPSSPENPLGFPFAIPSQPNTALSSLHFQTQSIFAGHGIRWSHNVLDLDNEYDFETLLSPDRHISIWIPTRQHSA